MNATTPIIAAPPTFEQVLIQVGIAKKHCAQFRNIRLPFHPRPTQMVSLQAALYWDRHGLFDEARTGKTIVMQLAAIWFRRYGMRSAILMPPSLFDQFVAEYDRIENHGMDVRVFDMGPKTREALLEDLKYNRDNVDVLAMSKEIFKKHINELLGTGFKVLMFDECHMGLQSESMRTGKKGQTIYACTKQFSEVPENRLILSTGTPLYNEVKGTYPIISLKTPEAYTSRREFDYHHTSFKPIVIKTPRGDKTIQVEDGDKYRNLNALSENLFKQSTRALKLEVLDASAPNIQIVPIRLHKPHQQLYRKLLNDRILEIDGELIDARQQAKLRAVALQLIMSPNTYSEKPIKNSVIELVQTLLDTSDIKHTKVLMFANFTQSVETLAQAFERYNPAVIYGPNGPKTNRIHIKKFQEDNTSRVAIANPRAGGVGLTFGHVSHTVIVVEPISVPGEFDQAISRVILSGQGNPVVVYIIRVNGTISPRGLDAMIGKGVVSKEVTKDKKTVLDELLGIV